ncbi:uncharacterized protein LOC118197002 isoform X2 [Stegodyphus dumicola]|uniref:uncharacterized protein LOC118197002 isoform X2 n=1 Tax=Stegodyphus dumicola TaxID=202533 RepID=UPI0015AD0759|nr:uncharacterized protein LOC118197002 isoform X2 [Stegodyphus dumicola]
MFIRKLLSRKGNNIICLYGNVCILECAVIFINLWNWQQNFWKEQQKLDVVFTVLGTLGQRYEEFVFEIEVMESDMINETLARYCETTLTNICLNINTCDSLKLYSDGF